MRQSSDVTPEIPAWHMHAWGKKRKKDTSSYMVYNTDNYVFIFIANFAKVVWGCLWRTFFFFFFFGLSKCFCVLQKWIMETFPVNTYTHMQRKLCQQATRSLDLCPNFDMVMAMPRRMMQHESSDLPKGWSQRAREEYYKQLSVAPFKLHF